MTKVNIKDDDHTGFFYGFDFLFYFQNDSFQFNISFHYIIVRFSLFLVFCCSSIVVLVFYDCQIYCASWCHSKIFNAVKLLKIF